jgi:hypothetical protein
MHQVGNPDSLQPNTVFFGKKTLLNLLVISIWWSSLFFGICLCGENWQVIDHDFCLKRTLFWLLVDLLIFGDFFA